MLFFSPFYLYIPIFYTDTLSMPFLAAVPLMVDSCCENKETENTSGLRGKILPIMLGILLFIGSAIKGSLLILLIAVSIYTILRLNWKRWLPVLSCVFLGFILSSFMWSTFVFDTGIVTRESSYEHKFPPQHWVMMGMQGRGNFNNDDVKYTASFSGYDKKVQATTKEIKRRADEMKICGLLRQAYKKATTYAWNYGTYYAERYLGDQGDEPVRYNWLHEFVLSQGKYHAWFYILTQGYYLFLFLGMVIGLAYAAMHKLNLMYFFQTISLLGCLIFFMLWETHPRYILHFSVFFITVGTVGWECVLHPKTS